MTAESLQLLHMYGVDVNGGEFQWSADLERRADGPVYLVLTPTVDEGVEIEEPDPIAIDGGADLFKHLGPTWYEYAGEGITEAEWKQLARKVYKFDKAFGGGLTDHLRQEFDPLPVEPADAELWVRRATWERKYKGRLMGYLPQEDIRRNDAVLSYVMQYRERTGSLPTGRHQIDADIGCSFEAVFPQIGQEDTKHG